jgi:hypothetical protein
MLRGRGAEKKHGFGHCPDLEVVMPVHGCCQYCYGRINYAHARHSYKRHVLKPDMDSIVHVLPELQSHHP